MIYTLDNCILAYNEGLMDSSFPLYMEIQRLAYLYFEVKCLYKEREQLYGARNEQGHYDWNYDEISRITQEIDKVFNVIDTMEHSLNPLIKELNQ
jgi:hypothetical protein